MDSHVDAVYISSINLGNECIQVYDAETGTNIKSYRGNCVAPNTLSPIGPQDYLICGQKDKPLLEAWGINQHEAVQLRFTVPGRVTCLTVNAAGPKYCAVGIEEKIYIYHLQSGHLLGVVRRHYQPITVVRFTPCGNYFASAGQDGFVYLWSKRSLIENLHKADRPQIEPHYIIGQHLEKVTGLSISSHGMRGLLITASLDNSCKVFDLNTGRLRHNIVLTEPITSVAFNSIGSQAFMGSVKGHVWGVSLVPVHHTTDIEVNWPASMCHEKAVRHVATTSNGYSLVTGSDDGEVKLFTIVMTRNTKSLKEKGVTINSSTMSFAFQRTLHVGRGPISNLFTQRIDREIFNASNLSSSIVVAPFSSQKSKESSDSMLTTPVQIPIKNINRRPMDARIFMEAAALVLSQTSSEESSDESDHKGRNKRKNGISTESETNALAKVQRLSKANQDLYKLCLKNFIVGEGD